MRGVLRQTLGESRLQPLVRSAEAKDGQACLGNDAHSALAKRDAPRAPGLETLAPAKALEAPRLVALLKDCAKQKDLLNGSRLHSAILRKGLFQQNIYIGNTLINMYARCGVLAKAQQVFDELPVRSVVSWTALITGYAQHGHGEEALNCFERMQCEGLSPNAMTFACILKACGSIQAADKGEKIHDQIVREGLLAKDGVLGTALVDMYAKCGRLAKAQQVFDKLPVQDVVSWTALISGYAQHGHDKEALNCFEQCQRQGLSPNAVTLACILKVCGSMGAIAKGEELHSKIVREGLLGNSSLLANATVDMYAKCGALAKAQQAFDELSVRDVHSWNALIAGYAKCGAIVKAQQVFDELPVRDVVSWTALIAGYAQHGHGDEALNCFEQMQREGLSPNAMTFTCILKACSSIGAAEKGSKIHAKITKEGLLGKDSVLGTALVDMYAQCGALAKAEQVFDDLPKRYVDSWTALIAGYAQFGKHDFVFDLFNKMIGEGVEPDLLTFSVVLNSCSHSGLVDRGEMCFETMSTRYALVPTVEHYTCMVDLFGHVGQFHKALAVIKKMPSSNHLPVWIALLGACQKWGKVDLGRLAFEEAVWLDEKSSVAYVRMSNIYAAAGMQQDADKIEALRLKNEAWKKPGRCWWSNSSGDVHSFYVEDPGHLESKDTYSKLKTIACKMSQQGYCPDLHWASQDI